MMMIMIVMVVMMVMVMVMVLVMVVIDCNVDDGTRRPKTTAGALRSPPLPRPRRPEVHRITAMRKAHTLPLWHGSRKDYT